VQSQQRSNDLGLFEHDDRSATETDGASSSMETTSEVNETHSDSSNDSDSDDYLPPNSNPPVTSLDSTLSTGSEDALDFLSPSKMKKDASRRDAASTLSEDMDNLSFHTKT
jgi:hypothetical protein